ncbi:glutamate synthase [Clostridium sp. BJN0013]|uniref:GltB/FmdC/FwdC-like GXGXG domain-containing protein n=1 Tax=Clostridium sp. BJN0013 TaxID=3236840 RepID=UPI0034C6A326
MEFIDAKNLKSKELNEAIRECFEKDNEVTVQNCHSMHNVAIGLSQKGTVMIKGSTGFYTGGFLEGTKVVVDGNVGWYVGDNMMDGELIVTKNTGCNAGSYFYGGTMVIYGGTGSRVGYGMKGGTIIVCGSAGMWAGQMTLGGKLIILGKVGKKIGESMYKGVIFTQDKDVENKIGGNVYVDNTTEEEKGELNQLFIRYDIKTDADNFKAIRPSSTGRHKYILFKPQLSKKIDEEERNIWLLKLMKKWDQR